MNELKKRIFLNVTEQFRILSEIQNFVRIAQKFYFAAWKAFPQTKE